MSKGPVLQALWDALPKERQQQIAARTRVLEDEYRSLQALRKRKEKNPPKRVF